jgi:hypothetical protein
MWYLDNVVDFPKGKEVAALVIPAKLNWYDITIKYMTTVTKNPGCRVTNQGIASGKIVHHGCSCSLPF